MSLTIQQLNADTTFLLTFAPPYAPERLSKRFQGDYTILIDPWLRGRASILHPTFQASYHTSTPALHSLEDLNLRPDLIIISQDKPDHCHRETLCSLPVDSKVNILATPAAAKKIRSWKHFDAEKVFALKAYSPCNPDSVVRISIPRYSPTGTEGEITIVNMPTKRDMTGLHNAIGITYQAPTTVLTLHTQRNRLSNDMSSAQSSPRRPRTRAGSGSARPVWLDALKHSRSTPDLKQPSPQPEQHPTPPKLRERSATDISRKPSSPTFQEKTISILYTPHGVSTRILEPYFRQHLTPLAALPVSALFHGINMEENPWFMGGTVSRGAPGGVEIARKMGVEHWISAHDEAKLNKGLAAAWLKSSRFGVEEVEDMLRDVGLPSTKVHQLSVGETMTIQEMKTKAEYRQQLEGALGLHAVDDVPPVPQMPTRFRRLTP